MNAIKTTVAFAIGAAFATSALAQNADSIVQRDVNQQTRIEQGLKSGQLSTGEASQLERGEARIERTEARDLSKGPLTQQEKTQINHMQNAESRAIYQDKHNGIVGNPNSASSQRMQADVQRNVNQQRRVEQGLRSGSLTNREAGHLERGQAHVNQKEARAGRDGYVGAREQHQIQGAENRQSSRIYAAKHDGAHR